MLYDLNKKKLIELSEKVICIEKEILLEEQDYQNALIHEAPTYYLLLKREQIKLLQRKEIIFSGVIETTLQKLLKRESGFEIAV